jgi:hypothetical protein
VTVRLLFTENILPIGPLPESLVRRRLQRQAKLQSELMKKSTPLPLCLVSQRSTVAFLDHLDETLPIEETLLGTPVYFGVAHHQPDALWFASAP